MMEVVLGVTGGIAAYKAADIVRGLQREGAGVTVVMTGHALEFITPLTLQTLSGRPVITSHFAPSVAAQDAGDVEHIGLARRCDLLLVAPATASTLGKMAAGICDDFLTTFYLAVTCPVAVAPAMNTTMWEHPAVQENLSRLLARGVQVIGPESGPLASRGEGEGMGRLAHPDMIVRRAMQLGRSATSAAGGAQSLSGRHVLVTAGPTREAIDPVRYLSNPSTGKMGYAVAEAARDMGARVTLVSGPTHLPDPPGVKTLRVTSAQQMRDAVLERLDGPPAVEVVVMAAAVSDFRPARREPNKVKKEMAALDLAMERTPDILAEMGAGKTRRIVVGFAAETEDVAANARLKLEKKKLDLIVANNVAGDGAHFGFGAETNEVIVIDREGNQQQWPRMTKHEVARRLMDLVAGRLP